MKSSYNNSITYKEIIDGIIFVKNNKKIVEFGILEGLSLTSFVENSVPTCQINAYDIFEEFNGNSANKKQLLEQFSKYKNVNIEYGDFYNKYKDIIDNSIDIIHIDIANNGETYEYAINNYISKLTKNGIMIIEGGSEERDNIEWMNKYNKPKIKQVIEKYSNKYTFKTIGNIPSITLIHP